MKVLFINNDGGGYADTLEVEPGTTITKFIEEQTGTEVERQSSYMIRVNRQPVSADYQLQDGDRISCTPTKIDGAA